MQVRNAIYYHIHKKGPVSSRWEVGNTILLGKNEHNLFYSFYDNYHPTATVGSEVMNICRALNIFLQLPQDVRHKEYEAFIKLAHGVIREQNLFIRETIFEEVRAKHFPHLPSRKSCIWVCEENAVSYWWKTLNGEKVIFKLNLTGVIHKTDQKYLNHEVLPHNQLRANAFHYWSGSDGSNPIEEELLFEGLVTIIDSYNSDEDLKNSSSRPGHIV